LIGLRRTSQSARRSRRHPRATQFDYLHLRRLVEDLETALRAIGPAQRVLDVFCGSRPYEDLLPARATRVGFDVADHYGLADVVSDEFLPFADASFDLVVCFEAFHFVADARRGVSEIARVLQPGGALLISVPLAWEYSRTGFEHRYTASSLAALFAGWHEVNVVENGGWAVTWTSVSASLVRGVEQYLRGKATVIHTMARPLFGCCYLLLNTFGVALDAVEQRLPQGSTTLPVNILLTARRPLVV
jgi:SAM-dependent methyltransferase